MIYTIDVPRAVDDDFQQACGGDPSVFFRQTIAGMVEEYRKSMARKNAEALAQVIQANIVITRQ